MNKEHYEFKIGDIAYRSYKLQGPIAIKCGWYATKKIEPFLREVVGAFIGDFINSDDPDGKKKDIHEKAKKIGKMELDDKDLMSGKNIKVIATALDGKVDTIGNAIHSFVDGIDPDEWIAFLSGGNNDCKGGLFDGLEVIDSKEGALKPIDFNEDIDFSNQFILAGRVISKNFTLIQEVAEMLKSRLG